MRPIEVYFTEHFINNTVTQFFAKACGPKFKNIREFKKEADIIFASYGIKRNTDKAFLNSKDYIYIDHGYLNSTEREFKSDKSTIMNQFNGYFRVVKNDFYFNQDCKITCKNRFNNLGVVLKDLNKNGEKIILSEPSEDTKNFLKIPNWTQETLNEIKKYSDREIIIHNKFSKVPLNFLLKEAFAFVSCQSTAGFKTIVNGVPSYFTHQSLKKHGNIKNIEKQELNYELLYIAANSQWKLKEFFLDEFNLYLNKIIS